MAGVAALSLINVEKRFGGLTVADKVSFDVPVGSRTALIGPNGAGKTTLFNLISGIYPIDDGSIVLAGRPIERLSPRERVRAGLSRSFQNIRLMPHLSVVENVMLGQHVRAGGVGALLSPIAWQRGNLWRKQAEQRLQEAGIDVDPDAAVDGLPYGVRKKIEVVRALMSRPSLLMLDEPAAGLNSRETVELSRFLKSIAWDGLTMLVVEHDMSFVHDLCEQTVVLNFGRLIYNGPTRKVQDDEAVRAAYLGSRRIKTEERNLLLEVENLDVWYGRNHAVKGVSLTVGADELVAVVGANGAGKSSLLRALQGLTPAGGAIRFDGKDITALTPPQRIRRQLVLVPEGRQIILSLSVHENLQMGAYCRSDDTVTRDIDAIYDRFPNLAARQKMPASVLSGGEQQMLAIGRALLAKPKLMMLDEPSLGLSPLLVEQLFGLISSLREDGLAILLVEQNTHMALEIASRGLVMDLGRVDFQGSASELLQSERLTHAYLGQI